MQWVNQEDNAPQPRIEVKPSVFGSPAVDCDLHISVPSTKVLLPYLDTYWREAFLTRGIDKISWTMTCDPPNAPISGRPDWRPSGGRPGTDIGLLRTKALDAFGTTIAIANCLYGGAALHSEDMASVVCRAVNDWIAAEWLSREPRLRASIVVPLNNPELAAEEIERRVDDKGFVQVLLMAMGEQLLGRRHHWPIYRAAERYGLPIGVHAGSVHHQPPMAGWGSHFLEDYVAQSFGFESQVLSLVAEGTFAKFPNLKFVFLESGVSWLPACLWRFNKTWRGVRAEVPWVKRPPVDLVREHIRLTIQPFDEPDGGSRLERIVEQLGSDRMLLFSTDFPHWHYEGLDALPIDVSSTLARRILFDNPVETYSRLCDLAPLPQEVVQ
jgi:hypothetical protein